MLFCLPSRGSYEETFTVRFHRVRRTIEHYGLINKQVRYENALWIRNWRMLLYMRRADAACAVIRWPHFSALNDIMAAILKLWHKIKNPTPSIDAYLLEEQSCQISSWSDLTQWSPRLFEDGRPTRRTRTTIWVALWDQFLIQQNASILLNKMQVSCAIY